MSFGLKVTGKDKAYIKQKVEQAAKTLDIDHLLDRLPRELSGSQRKRVAIVRAIVRDPKVFLFDEPLSNLDAAFKVQTRVEIGKMHKKLGATIVYVTHAQVEAMTLGDKIVVMNDGRVEQCGIPLPLYQHPLTKFVAGFIGLSKMNFMEATVRVVETDHLLLALSDGSNTQAFVDVTGCNLDDVVTFNIRPEHLTQSPTHSMRLSATVTLVEQLGESSYLYLKLTDGTELVMRTYGESTTTIGEMIDISYNADDAHVFNSDGSALKRLKAGNTKSPAELVRLKQLVS
jgi:ABC-type sugar transport system ATPase subunit